MSDIYLSPETEEAREQTNFSLLALAGFVFAMIGLFSIQYFQVLPAAFIGAALGACALVIASRYRIGWFSRTLAFIAVVAGAVIASFNLFYVSIENNYDYAQAKKTAQAYVDNLSAGDLDRVFFLVGFPPGGGEPVAPGVATESPTVRAMNRLKEDPAHVEIQSRKNAKWVFVGIESEYPGNGGHTYKLLYKDDKQSIPTYYRLYVRKNCAKYDTTKAKVNWYVDRLESTTKFAKS
jgi:hypothetical protein